MGSAPLYGPFILAPPLTSCESAYLVFGQGTPPYTISIAGTGDANFTALESLPLQSTPGVYKWHTDFNAGANLTFVLTDKAGQHAYSAYRVVQAGAVSTCPRGQPKKSNNHAGAIAGGIIGAVVLVLILLSAYWFVRRARRRVAMQAAAERDAQYAAHVAIQATGDKDTDEDTALGGDGPAGVVRAGTFNLGAVRFTEDSLDHLRAIDRPPAYDVPPARADPASTPAPGPSGLSSPARTAGSTLSATQSRRSTGQGDDDEGDEIRELPPR
ncbi:hypothetical protein JCM10908_004063 [Rhodotorula pacifica]|uniref:uncharacterized protein n=1 Tax=Rhodotorula pacifica TaxID=1495444 RepID=UPI003180D9C3